MHRAGRRPHGQPLGGHHAAVGRRTGPALDDRSVPDWLSRYQERAPALGRGLTAWAVDQGEEVGRLDLDGDRAAVAALRAAWRAWRLRCGSRPLGPWRLWGLITGGRGP